MATQRKAQMMLCFLPSDVFHSHLPAEFSTVCPDGPIQCFLELLFLLPSLQGPSLWVNIWWATLMGNLAFSNPAAQPAEPNRGSALTLQRDLITTYQIKSCPLNGLKHFSCAASIQETNENNTNKRRISFWTTIQIYADNSNNSCCFNSLEM